MVEKRSGGYPCLYVADLLVGHGHVMRASAVMAGLGSFPVSRCRLCWSLAYQSHAGTRFDFEVSARNTCCSDWWYDTLLPNGNDDCDK
jgi:hypothetical protein